MGLVVFDPVQLALSVLWKLTMFTGPIIRIALRYVAGALVVKGVLQAEDAQAIAGDQDLIDMLTVLAGLGIGVLTEWWYWLASKFGWKK